MLLFSHLVHHVGGDILPVHSFGYLHRGHRGQPVLGVLHEELKAHPLQSGPEPLRGLAVPRPGLRQPFTAAREELR